jgi:hypothetical protein
MRTGVMRPLRGSIQATPDASGGIPPFAIALVHPIEDPENLARKISGKRRTIARFAALSTSSQHDATRNAGEGTDASTSATFRLVDRDALPRSVTRFQISTRISTSAPSSRIATSTTPGATDVRVGISKTPVRPFSRASRSTSSCAARCPASVGSGEAARFRENEIANGREIAMPSRLQVDSVADAPKPRSSSEIRVVPNPTRRPSWCCV